MSEYGLGLNPIPHTFTRIRWDFPERYQWRSSPMSGTYSLDVKISNGVRIVLERKKNGGERPKYYRNIYNVDRSSFCDA